MTANPVTFEAMAPSALVRSASFHNVGDDGGGGGASTSASANAEDTGVTITTLTMDRFESFAKCHNDSFGTKVSCLCVPVASGPDRFRSFYTKNPDRLALCGVALRASGEVVGYVQYAPFPYSDKDGLHETKEGECYVSALPPEPSRSSSPPFLPLTPRTCLSHFHAPPTPPPPACALRWSS